MVNCFVDDLLVFAEGSWRIEERPNGQSTQYFHKDMRRPMQFPNIQSDYRVPREIRILQKTLIDELLANKCMELAKPVDSAMSLAHDFSERAVVLMATETTDYRSLVGRIV